MGQPSALVVKREHKHLRLPGQAPKGARVQDAVPISLEAGAQGIRLLWHRSVPCAAGPGGAGGEQELLGVLTSLPCDQLGADYRGRTARMGEDDLAHRHPRWRSLARSHVPTVATKGDRDEAR